MTTGRRWPMALMAVGVIWLQFGTASAAPLAAAHKCEVAKLSAARKKEKCLVDERVKEVRGQAFNYAKCDAAFAKAFTKAETDAGAGVCPSEGDEGAVEALIDVCFDDLKAALSGSPNPPCTPGAFPATGQTTCYDSAGLLIACVGTGQDGDIRAGGELYYTDNGDGTITDNNTGLMWEKKSDDGTIHDKDNTYSWAHAFTVHIAGLNAANFAGHADWRLPHIKELQSIVNYENENSAVSPAFNTGCVASCTVLTCSCTAADRYYWSSSTNAVYRDFAWSVYSYSGGVIPFSKNIPIVVRAVRGGL